MAATPLVTAYRQAARVSGVVSYAVRELGHGGGGNFDFATGLRQGKAGVCPATWIDERQVEDGGSFRAEVATEQSSHGSG